MRQLSLALACEPEQFLRLRALRKLGLFGEARQQWYRGCVVLAPECFLRPLHRLVEVLLRQRRVARSLRPGDAADRVGQAGLAHRRVVCDGQPGLRVVGAGSREYAPRIRLGDEWPGPEPVPFLPVHDGLGHVGCARRSPGRRPRWQRRHTAPARRRGSRRRRRRLRSPRERSLSTGPSRAAPAGGAARGDSSTEPARTALASTSGCRDPRRVPACGRRSRSESRRCRRARAEPPSRRRASRSLRQGTGVCAAMSPAARRRSDSRTAHRSRTGWSRWRSRPVRPRRALR